jgi:hypothetical protein
MLRGIDKRKPLILTDRPGRKAFWSKRLARPLYDRQLAHMGARIRQSEQQQPKEPS